jgi:ubiquinone/menaquinone biosynthesis C-methylase UbiE
VDVQWEKLFMQGNDYIEANRRAWNQVAPIHATINQARLVQSFKRPGFSVLDSYETEKLLQIGVKGKSVAQLACNNGRELLSIKNMGAGRCVGFDIAEEFIKQAEALNQAAQFDCEFVTSNILEIPERYNQQFELIYISIGVLSWMPDLNAFFAVVARLLKPQGHLMIYEMHPFLNMLDAPSETDNPLQISLSYFNQAAQADTTSLDYYERTPYEALPKYWFAHSLASLLTALIANQIAISAFDEYAHDISELFKPLEQYQKIPLSYILVGEKQG